MKSHKCKRRNYSYSQTCGWNYFCCEEKEDQIPQTTSTPSRTNIQNPVTQKGKKGRACLAFAGFSGSCIEE